MKECHIICETWHNDREARQYGALIFLKYNVNKSIIYNNLEKIINFGTPFVTILCEFEIEKTNKTK